MDNVTKLTTLKKQRDVASSEGLMDKLTNLKKQRDVASSEGLMDKLTKLTTLKNRLSMYLEAEQKILNAQEYQIADRSLKRASLSEIRKAIADLQDEIALLEKGAGRIKAVVF